MALVAPSLAVAGQLSTGADFLLMTTGARPDGMGQAFSAVADDINTLSFNPAGLGNIRLPEVGYGHENFVAGIGFDFVGAAIPMGDLGVLGLGYLGMGTAPFNSTVNPLAPNVSSQDMALTGGWGKSFYDLHVGVAAKYIMRQVDTIRGNGFAFDVGLRYRLLPYLTLAASALNLGPPIQLTTLDPLPMVAHGGAAWEVFQDSSNTLNLTSDASYNFTTQLQRYSLGMEYWFRDAVALRAGYLYIPNSDDQGISAGAGVNLGFVQLDYAYQPFNVLGSVHRVSGILRWDGPWVSGGEPNAPKHVSVVQDKYKLRIRWEKASGPVESYEVLIQPLDDSDLIVSKPVANPVYEFSSFSPEVLYKVSVRSIGHGGIRSFSSDEAYFEPAGVPGPSSTYYARKGEPVPNRSVASGIEGKVDRLGLRLSWAPVKGMGEVGYHLYRRSPQGKVERVTLEPKKSNRLWITDTSGLEGWKWIVTAVNGKGREKNVGSYLWFPSSQEVEMLGQTPDMRLDGAPEPHHEIFLDWDRVPYATSYSLFISHKADGVYEYFKDLNRNKITLLLKGSKKDDRYYFIIVPKDAGGALLKRSNESKVDLLF